MTQLKVKASSKPSTQNSKKNGGSLNVKPTTALGRFNHTFFEGSGVNQSIMMAGMAALGMGGAYGVVNKLMPTMRQAAGLPLAAMRSLWGKKSKDSNDDDTGIVSGAIAKNRATEASRGIRTLTKVTKKGFADVLKAMGAAPGQTKKKKSLWEMLTDAITGGLSKGGGVPFLGGGSFLWRMLKYVGIGFLGNAFLGSIRNGLGINSTTTGGRAARFAGDAIITNYALSQGKNAYKTYTGAKTAQAEARFAKALAGGHKVLSNGRKVKTALAFTRTGIKAAGLATATATSAWTLGLSFLIEEAVMNLVVDPLINRYIRTRPEMRTITATAASHARGGKLTVEDQKQLDYYYANTGGGMAVTDNLMEIAIVGSSLLFGNHYRGDQSKWTDEEKTNLKRLEQVRDSLFKKKDPKAKAYANKVEEYIRAVNESHLYDQWNAEIEYTKGTQNVLKTARNMTPAQNIVASLTGQPTQDKLYAYGMARLYNLDLGQDYNGAYNNKNYLEKAQLLYNTAATRHYQQFLDKTVNDLGITNLQLLGNNTYKEFTKAVGGTGEHTFLKNANKFYGQTRKANELLTATGKSRQELIDTFGQQPLAIQQALLMTNLRNPSASSDEYNTMASQVTSSEWNQLVLDSLHSTDVLRRAEIGTALDPNKTLTKDTLKKLQRGLDWNDDISTFKFGEHLSVDNAFADSVVSELGKMQNGKVDEKAAESTIVHQETTDLISAQNQLDFHIAQLTSILTGQKLETLESSGNPVGEVTQSDISSSSSSPSGPGAIKQYLSKIENLQTNYSGKISELGD